MPYTRFVKKKPQYYKHNSILILAISKWQIFIRFLNMTYILSEFASLCCVMVYLYIHNLCIYFRHLMFCHGFVLIICYVLSLVVPIIITIAFPYHKQIKMFMTNIVKRSDKVRDCMLLWIVYFLKVSFFVDWDKLAFSWIFD